LDNHFADVNGTNIVKQFYRKKDLIKQDESGEELPDANNEDLVEHKSANMLNNMLPLLGKRPAVQDGDGAPEKRRKLASMTSFTKA
jgi:SpoVK/Ycf46/Vps4 family AAA+-type ATPase